MCDEKSFLLLLAVISLFACSVFADSVSIGDYFLTFEVPRDWKELVVKNLNTDISTKNVQKAFALPGNAVLLVTAQRDKYALSVEEWLPAIRSAFSTGELKLDKSQIIRFGANDGALIVVSGKGNGQRLDMGSVATSRQIVFFANGPDVIQFILTAPSDKFLPLADEVQKVARSVSFAKKVLAPTTAGDVPVADVLAEAGLEAAEFKKNSTFDVALWDAEKKQGFFARVIKPTAETLYDENNTWEVEKAKLDGVDYVVLYSPKKLNAWVFKTEDFVRLDLSEDESKVIVRKLDFSRVLYEYRHNY